MNSFVRQTWIPIDRISSIVELEQALVLALLALGVYAFYRFFLRDVSKQRHDNLKRLFVNLGFHCLFGAFFFVAFISFQWLHQTDEFLGRVEPYLGLITLISWCIIFVKVARIFIFEYLFIGHMKEGVPLLLVNIFSLILSVAIGLWIVGDIFDVKLTPLLATSAVFSVVLGLALQDTLGNLFAGVALQLDKPYEIGDWIELFSGDKKYAGQVLEISWRSTVLLAFTEELITIPNRSMSSAQISNFSPNSRPIVRSVVVRVGYDVDLDKTKDILVKCAQDVGQILPLPAPIVLVNETTESWILLKVIYYIHNYGSQYSISDQLYSKIMVAFRDRGIEFAPPRLSVLKTADRSGGPPAAKTAEDR